MYKCALCRKTTQPREQMNKLILEKRVVEYSNGARGWEIAREVAVCYDCATMQPRSATDSEVQEAMKRMMIKHNKSLILLAAGD